MTKQELFERQLRMTLHAEELMFDTLTNLQPSGELLKTAINNHLDETDDNLDQLGWLFEVVKLERYGEASSIEAVAHEVSGMENDAEVAQGLLKLQALVLASNEALQLTARSLDMGSEVLHPLEEIREDDQAFFSKLAAIIPELLYRLD